MQNISVPYTRLKKVSGYELFDVELPVKEPFEIDVRSSKVGQIGICMNVKPSRPDTEYG